MGFFASIYHSSHLRSLNKNGVVVSLGHLQRYILPGFFSGVVSAVLYAINQGNDGNHFMNFPAGRTNIIQGGYHIAGLSLWAGIGIYAGIIVCIILKLINHQ